MRSNLRALILSFASLFSITTYMFPVVAAVQSAGGDKTPLSAEASANSDIQVETWAAPQHGWLYVLDPHPDGVTGGRIWLLDPESGKVMGSIRTGDNADFALSPDGARLYVASSKDEDSSELAVVDTLQGAIVKSGIVHSRAVSNGLPSFSTMAVSGDGAALRILIVTPKSDDRDAFLLATFDTATGEFLPGIVHLGNCGPGRFIAYAAADHFDYFCPRTNRVRLIGVDAESHELRNQDVVLPWERRIGVAEAVESPGSDSIAIIRGDGAVFPMTVATQKFGDALVVSSLANRIPPAAWPTSPDGRRIYLGYNREYVHSYDNRFYLDYGRPPNVRPEGATAAELRVYDTSTWRKIGAIKTKIPFWSAAISSDGKTVYAMAPQKHSLIVIDTEKMRQVRVLKIAGTPALALVAP